MKPLKKFIPRIKKEFHGPVLNLSNTHAHPMFEFDLWFKEAHEIETSVEVNAFTLSTVSENGWPDSRVVLMKSYSEEGIKFFTNYNSKKARDLLNSNKVSVNFYWPDMNRQIRLLGLVTKTSSEESREYFDSRPHESKISAFISKQSEKMDQLQREEFFNKLEENIEDFDIKEKWGGYCIKIMKAEFWQGQRSRCHDRVVYELSDKGAWDKFMLYP